MSEFAQCSNKFEACGRGIKATSGFSVSGVSEFAQCSKSIGRTRSVSVGMLLDK